VRSVVIAVMLVLLAGCTRGPGGSQSRSPRPAGSPPAALGASPAGAEKVRGCADSATMGLPGGGPNSAAAVCLPVDVGWEGQTARLTLALLRGGC
jgi:hypothetical protein